MAYKILLRTNLLQVVNKLVEVDCLNLLSIHRLAAGCFKKL